MFPDQQAKPETNPFHHRLRRRRPVSPLGTSHHPYLVDSATMRKGSRGRAKCRLPVPRRTQVWRLIPVAFVIKSRASRREASGAGTPSRCHQ